jgi:hypothetical protein
MRQIMLRRIALLSFVGNALRFSLGLMIPIFMLLIDAVSTKLHLHEKATTEHLKDKRLQRHNLLEELNSLDKEHNSRIVEEHSKAEEISRNLE